MTHGVAAEADAGRLKFCRKVSSTGFSTSRDAPSTLSRSEPQREQRAGRGVDLGMDLGDVDVDE
jgi:hypothetical protein